MKTIANTKYKDAAVSTKLIPQDELRDFVKCFHRFANAVEAVERLPRSEQIILAEKFMAREDERRTKL